MPFSRSTFQDRCKLNLWLLGCLCLFGGLQVGCWAPMRKVGIPATSLPDSFRMPTRTGGQPLNFSQLTLEPPKDYILGTNDQLDVMITGLHPEGPVVPIRVQIMANGSIQLPLVGTLTIGGMNLLEAQQSITRAYANGYLANPHVNLALVEKDSISVLVLGEVGQPGVHVLPKFTNDIGHAIASAGGFTEDAAEEIEVHRRIREALPLQPASPIPPTTAAPMQKPIPAQEPSLLDPPMTLDSIPSNDSKMDHPWGEFEPLEHHTSNQVNYWLSAPVPVEPNDPPSSRIATTSNVDQASFVAPSGAWPGYQPVPVSPSPPPVINLYKQPRLPQWQVVPPTEIDGQILRIPLRTQPGFQLSQSEITLHDGDVVVVPSRRNDVFFVVGKLSTNNTVRYTIGNRDRELGVGLVLPRERDIDVVTAVAMAGYIDPIDSPTTVTLQREAPDGSRLLVLVDLIEARCNPRATILVQAGDIIYLNPDGPWYLRRTIDRVLPEFITSPYNFLMRKSILGDGNL